MRSCHRTGCRWPAVASLSFRYATRQAWVLDLAEAPDPSLYDLCPHHADSLSVPRGWERVDQRTAGSVVAEPAGADLLSEPVGRDGYGGNRYAALSAALPRLAAEVAAEGDHARTPDPSVTADEASAAPTGQAAAAAEGRPPEVPGQLTLPLEAEPIDGGPQARDEDAGVVVLFAAAGARRRGER